MVGARPRRTTILVATAGHFQNMAGMRDFVALLRRSDRGMPGGGLGRRLGDFEIAYFLGLDLSSHARRIGLVQAGSPYRVRKIEPLIYDRVVRFARDYEETVLGGEMILGGELKPRRQRRLVGQLPKRVSVEGAVVNLAGYLGLTFVTAADERAAFDSPLDLPHRVEVENLAVQVRFIGELIGNLVDDRGNGVQIAERKDSFGTLRGRVLTWGAGSYGPERPVANAWVRVRTLHKSMMGMRPDPLALSDSSGRFVLEGLEAKLFISNPCIWRSMGWKKKVEGWSLPLTTAHMERSSTRRKF